MSSPHSQGQPPRQGIVDLRINNNPSVFCPDLMECPQRITSNFFKYYCSCKGHKNCHHFNRKRDSLKSPIQWIQQLAVQGFKPKVETSTPRKGQTDLRSSK